MHPDQQRSRRSPVGSFAVWVAACLGLACQTPVAPPSGDTPTEVPLRFDAARAERDVAALAAIGPRAMRSEGAAQARAYLRGELEALGLEIVEQMFPIDDEAREEAELLRNLVAAVPGTESPDVFLLMAPYDSEAASGRTSGEEASGAAVLLELARALSEHPLPYAVWFAFLDGETAPDAKGTGRRHYGSVELARRLDGIEARDRVRLAVAIERTCFAELRIARDLQSHRNDRRAFWRSARRIGRGHAFPRTARYESPDASHRALVDEGFRHVVALVGTRSEDPGAVPPADAGRPESCARDSLGAVGEVTLAAMERIAARRTKIDRFADTGEAEPLRLEALPFLRAIRPSVFNGIVRVEDHDGTRRLVTGPADKRLLQSSMDLAVPHRLVDNYTQISSVLTSLHASPERVFNIGLGGGVLPRFHLHRYENSRVRSVEIDPVVVAFAESFFGVVGPRHTILEGDGAAALRESEGGYDIIVVDAYSDTDGVPDVFTRRPFIDTLPKKLAPGGMVVANLWAKDSRAFERLVADYKRSFARGVRVTIPQAQNHIVAVGDAPGLTCDAFRDAVEAWTAEGIADVAWDDEGCTDL